MITSKFKVQNNIILSELKKNQLKSHSFLTLMGSVSFFIKYFSRF